MDYETQKEAARLIIETVRQTMEPALFNKEIDKLLSYRQSQLDPEWRKFLKSMRIPVDEDN